MSRNQSDATKAALEEYRSAPRGKKPSDIELGKKHGLNPSTIYRARMKRRGKKKESANV